MKNKVTFLLLLLFNCATIFAQQLKVTGTVSDESGNPLPGASVIVKNSTIGVQTDFDGKFTIDNLSNSATLVISYLGYISIEQNVNGQSTINVTLKEDSQALNEVVVIGYGKMNVKDLTSSITTIKSDEISKTPTGAAMQALQGKVAGLQVVSVGSPGESPTIRVRGIGSYPGSGSTSPLYVVDGMFFDNIDFLNTSDIVSISVLKDASASAIYGVKAANGVVLIETKSGGYNQKTEVVYDGYSGVQVAQNVLKMANAEQFTTMAIESGSAADVSFINNAMQRFGRSRINPNVPDVNTDWYQEILRAATIQNHSISISGGSENASYAIGTNYFAQEGVLDTKNEYERFNLRSKIAFKATDWLTVGGNMILSNATKYSPESSAWNQAYFAVPILPIHDEANTEAWPINYASAQSIGYRGGQNPFPSLDYNNNRSKNRKILANFYMEFNLIPKKLTFKTTYNHSNSTFNTRNVDLPYYITDGFQRPISAVTKRAENFSNQIWDNVLTYTNKFGDHDLTVMAGTSFRDDAWDMLTARGEEIPSIDQEVAWYISQAGTINVDSVNDGGSRQYGLSYFGRVSYNFNDKYLLYGTLRADGSSKYQEKWGYFPTIGAGWILSEEDFLKENDILNYLKLRASWGQLGNSNVPASDGANTTSIVDTAIDGVLVSGTVSSSTFSSLKWELTEETNVGITSRLLDNRLSIDADYFIRDTKEAVIPVGFPLIAGSVNKSVGSIRNSGFELAMNWNSSVSDNFKYTIGANISTLKNEVLDLYGQEYIDGGSAEFRQRSYVGEPLLAFYGREVVGVYQNDAQVQADPAAVANGLVPGDLIYKDQNNDGFIDDEDRVVLGSYLPSFMYGLNIGFTYKDFEFSTSMMGQTGNKILNRKRGELIWTSDGNLDADLAINRWHGEGTSNSYPSSAGLRKGWNQKMSDYFVEDGSFFRIQNIQMAYNIKTINMPNIRVSLTAERPFTSFKYNGFNPEVANGIDTQTYPIPAVYTLGVNIKI
ncbi:SusC/RagA family TonB-linked outer membrane protein [Lutibacter flavus]|uniref:TonB-linked outer membrane protein, SusC/RagA family n=1 Tax=Lutibacter flavus TaxID=691689 RepID=A0A238YIG4_9FLAO|nr:TonB-dependent receptor [Lutibacter flavus]SNR70393.1 TonB-linked outer membrane protein, SusC/RagA family [Lutibacter flavus]